MQACRSITLSCRQPVNKRNQPARAPPNAGTLHESVLIRNP